MRWRFYQSCLALALYAWYSTQAQEHPRALPSPGGLSPHAKEVLLAAARERAASFEVDRRSKDLVPLESLLARVLPNGSKIVRDVQFLLDFAVVGFGKCGTTTLLQWLQETSTPDNDSSFAVRAPNYEAQFLVNQRPDQLVRKMHQFAIEERELQQTNPNARILKGFKNPSDIRRQKSRDLLARYWPKTPLIVTVRHPVQWMVSIYNYYKIEKGRHKANLTADLILDRGGRDLDGDTHHFVSTAKGEFHAMLAELGKTPLLDDGPEWRWLQPWLDPSQTNRIRKHRLPNPIFFLEMGQLADANATRARRFAGDLEDFLGLPQGHLPPVGHVRPRADLVKLKETDGLKMDICHPQFAPVLDEMVAISRAASEWFTQYFIQSEDVTVSCPDYLRQLLEEWKINPCE